MEHPRTDAQARSARPWGARLVDFTFDTAQALAALVAKGVHEHPRRVWAAVAVVLTSTAMTAFAVATVGLTSAGTALPTVTVVDEALPLPQLAGQLDALSQGQMQLFSSQVTRASDTADTLLRRLGVNDSAAAAFIRSDAVASTVLSGKAGKMVQAMTDNGKLVSMVVRGPSADLAQVDSHFTRIRIERSERAGNASTSADSFTATTEQALLQVREQLATATVTSSLYAAADDAHVPEAITNQLAELFSADIDFRRELRRGDAFSVVYEGHTADGQPITWGGSAGKLLAARFINKGVVHDAVWFEEPGQKGAYFNLDGRSKNKAFLASPLAFSRITSGFAMRFHPILQRWKAHLGVDFGAPTGTPVRSVGDGVVSFAGVQNGYGNVVQITHSADRITKYAHLSRIDVRMGQKIEQGTTIGAVGATGWATGPHLHFEFLVQGQHVDPVTIARAADSSEISPQAAMRYRGLAKQMAERLDMATQMQTAGAQSGPRFE
jgi:murein DD-endopeptidase MepM/ murein hydrolase activator NlpD